MKLKTSNKNKALEFKLLFPELEIVEGEDKREVLGTLDEVIIYKTEIGFITEDTVLAINGEVKVDIKWNINSLNEGDDVEWIVSLGYSDGEYIYISRGLTKGNITKKRGTDGFGFDPYFIPEGEIKTLSELGDKKELFSARKQALLNFKNGNFVIKMKNSDLKEWTGLYQNE